MAIIYGEYEDEPVDSREFSIFWEAESHSRWLAMLDVKTGGLTSKNLMNLCRFVMFCRPSMVTLFWSYENHRIVEEGIIASLKREWGSHLRR